ncbi:MAG: heavy metal translocating P-type ATPase [bacterium]|nr:heavy metal translocating P-type ATPase [bacterium]
MITKTSRIKGMHCASCAAIIEKIFKKVEGVESVEVNYGTETAKVSFDESKTNLETISKKIEPLGYSLALPQPTAKEMNMSESEHAEHLGLNQSKKEKLAELSNMKKKLITAVPLAIVSAIFMVWGIFSKLGVASEIPNAVENVFQNLLPLIAAYTLFYIGQPYLMGFYRFLRYGKANMDTLIGIGTFVAFAYSLIITIFKDVLATFINTEDTYYDVTIVVITFITLGKYLEARSKIKTGDAIEKLINMQAKTALVVRNGHEQEIPISEVIHGDLILIKPAGKIPVDGVITEGASYVDESMITGEPIPVKKDVGENVVAGTINTSGAFTFKATKVGSETMLAHIIKMVEEAQGSKAPIQALADKISAVFVPVVLVLSFVVLGLWLIVGARYMDFSQALSFGLVSFVGILVIACPCALGLATPTAIIVGVGKGAKEGILVKDAATLEKLHKANVVVVDKTGTLTKGKPELVSVKNFSEKKDEELISILASLEKNSEHPIAYAVINYAKEKNISFAQINNFEAIKGKGVKGLINNTEYYAGNIKLMRDLNIQFDSSLMEKDTANGKTPVIIAAKEKVLGVVMIADAVKPESAEAVKRLHKLGIKVVMLTGDNKQTALYIAKEVGIDEVVAEVMPEDKLKKIKELQSQGKIVVMAGDGVNDAPALAQADIGIAMATGTDVAIESAGITLLHGDISKLVKAITLSKTTMRGIKQNLFWAFIYNIVGIPLAAGAFYPFLGWLLSPVFAGFAMAASSVSVVANSLRIKTKKL